MGTGGVLVSAYQFLSQAGVVPRINSVMWPSAGSWVPPVVPGVTSNFWIGCFRGDAASPSTSPKGAPVASSMAAISRPSGTESAKLPHSSRAAAQK